MKRAKAAAAGWWERQARNGVSGGQVAMTIFALKNLASDDWRDRIEHTGADGSPLTISIVRYAEEQPKVIDVTPGDSLSQASPRLPAPEAEDMQAKSVK